MHLVHLLYSHQYSKQIKKITKDSHTRPRGRRVRGPRLAAPPPAVRFAHSLRIRSQCVPLEGNNNQQVDVRDAIPARLAHLWPGCMSKADM
ncbi:hypothetical protein E2C01_019050 [Portunus trituberculatus]|uniref:Uncharacterized protein n=1 Tax=Portunus trituberculatus TaxID=210409 RepID=A0A5B7DY47_PORTR|nr:hypothetical protein [Portunus trituberculatus]